MGWPAHPRNHVIIPMVHCRPLIRPVRTAAAIPSAVAAHTTAYPTAFVSGKMGDFTVDLVPTKIVSMQYERYRGPC